MKKNNSLEYFLGYKARIVLCFGIFVSCILAIVPLAFDYYNIKKTNRIAMEQSIVALLSESIRTYDLPNANRIIHAFGSVDNLYAYSVKVDGTVIGSKGRCGDYSKYPVHFTERYIDICMDTEFFTSDRVGVLVFYTFICIFLAYFLTLVNSGAKMMLQDVRRLKYEKANSNFFFSEFSVAKKELDDNLIMQIQLAEISNERKLFDIAKRVAHDMRSPLSVISLLVSRMNIDQRKESQLLQSVVKRINGIAEDLLMSAKGAGSYLGGVTRFNVVSSVREVIEEKSFVLSDKISIELDSSDDEIFMQGICQHRLQGIVSNVVNNSIEAATENGVRIVVSIARKENVVLLSVVDNGKGMSQELLSKVGLEVVSYGKDISASSGSGIGVFSAVEYIKSVGGTVLIESKENQGTYLTFEIPCSAQL